jgi:hypothetical protein
MDMVLAVLEVFDRPSMAKQAAPAHPHCAVKEHDGLGKF